MKASQTETVIMLTCCALQSACYSPTGIVISFILAQFQGEVQTNLTVKRFLMCSAALCTSIAEELFIISRLSRSAERSKRIFTGGVVTASGICSAAFYESAALRESAAGLRPLSQNLTVLPDSPFCRCATSSPGAGEVFPQRESQEHCQKLSHYT